MSTEENKGRNKGWANLKPVQKGEVRNPNGRGHTRSARTVIWEAMKKIGSTRDMTPEQVEELLHQNGIAQALKGNHQFYQSISDRLYGKQKEKDVTVTVTQEVSPAVLELTKKLNDLHRGGNK